MRNERGLSLIELAITLFLASLLLTVTIVYGLPWLGREDLRSAVCEIQGALQLARVQSLARNRACVFVLDSTNRHIQVIDINNPSVTTDDIVLSDLRLPTRLSFGRPDSGSPITLASVTTGIYQATFAQDGSVSAGAGEIVLRGGDRYDRVTLYAAGGARVDRWSGTQWVSGS